MEMVDYLLAGSSVPERLQEERDETKMAVMVENPLILEKADEKKHKRSKPPSNEREQYQATLF